MSERPDLFGTPEMHDLFSERSGLQRMLDVEAALARAQARIGTVPAAAADAITAAASVERVDTHAIRSGTRVSGYPVIALTRELARVAGPDAARYIHWGATTQDVMDTALVLQLRDGLAFLERDLERLARALGERARAHRSDVMAGRTHLQHALPITFGYKCAIWLAPLPAHARSLRALRGRVLCLQFGGAVGTLASLGDHGRATAVALAEELGLAVADAPWHVRRESLAEAACVLGIVCGSLAKFATDVALLAQTEVAEVHEPHVSGRGGSSTMPQKRNPIAAEYVLAATRGAQALVPLMLAAMAQDHERATGAWQSEQLALPQIFILTSAALAHAVDIAEGMTVDAARMRDNLAATHGRILAEAVMMALAEEIGRESAHEVVERACDSALAERRPLADVLARDATVAGRLDRARIERLLDPASYLGEAERVVDRVLSDVQNVFGS
jgi:3-carboxy-cis,cis-muconate cycloisomerase